MKILITGAYGIVGSYLCKELKNEHEIIGIGRRKNMMDVINIIAVMLLIKSS